MQFYVIWNLQVLSHSLSVWAIPDIKKYRLNIFVQSSCNFLLKISEIKIIASEHLFHVVIAGIHKTKENLTYPVSYSKTSHLTTIWHRSTDHFAKGVGTELKNKQNQPFWLMQSFSHS